MKNALKTAIVIPVMLLVLVTAGCFSAGQPIPPDGVKKIVVGQTTRSEIQQAFGNPFRTGFSDTNETWTYVDYKVGLFGRPRANDLKITFDKQNKVLNFEYNTSEAGGGS